MTEKVSASPAIPCDQCLSEIPGSAHNFESDEYVYNFCGIDCYDQWLESQADSSE